MSTNAPKHRGDSTARTADTLITLALGTALILLSAYLALRG